MTLPGKNTKKIGSNEKQSQSIVRFTFYSCFSKRRDTVDGRNPGPPDMYVTLQIIGSFTISTGDFTRFSGCHQPCPFKTSPAETGTTLSRSGAALVDMTLIRYFFRN